MLAKVLGLARPVGREAPPGRGGAANVIRCP